MIWTAGNFVLKSYYSKLEPFVSLSLALPLITELKFIIFVILSTLLILVVSRTCFRHQPAELSNEISLAFTNLKPRTKTHSSAEMMSKTTTPI